MLLVLRSTSTSSATSVTASTAGYGGWAGGTIPWGGGAWQHGTREHIYTYGYVHIELYYTHTYIYIYYIPVGTLIYMPKNRRFTSNTRHRSVKTGWSA